MIMSTKILHNKRIYRGFLKLRFDMKLFIEDDNELSHLNVNKSKFVRTYLFTRTYRNDINEDIASLIWVIDKSYESDFISDLMQVMDSNNSDTNQSTLSAKDIKPFIKRVNLIIDYTK